MTILRDLLCNNSIKKFMKTEVQNLTGFERILNVSEENRFGVICIALLLVGCLGGITVGLGAINNVLALTVVVIPTMTTLVFY